MAISPRLTTTPRQNQPVNHQRLHATPAPWENTTIASYVSIVKRARSSAIRLAAPSAVIASQNLLVIHPRQA